MSNPPPTAPDNPILSYYREWSEKTPYVTRSTMIILLVSYVVSFFIETDKLLGNKPYFAYEAYRLFLSPLVGNTILNIVLAGLFFPALGGRMESSLGSSAFLMLLGTLTLATNITFVVVCFLLYYVANLVESVFYECKSFWVILFALITIECFQNPDQPRRMMMVPVDIPSKYFPLIMFVLFSLFTGPELDFAIAIAVGILYQKGYLNRLKLTSYYLESMEGASGSLHSVSRSRGWVLAGAALGHDAWIAVNSTTASAQQSSNTSTSSSAPAGRGGFGNWAAQENGTAGTGADAAGDGAPKTSTPFGGSGRALGGTSTSSGGGWLGGRPAASEGSSGQSKDREVMAARRLAALSQQQQQQQQQSFGPGSSVPGATSQTTEDNLNRLQEMGFQRSDAQRALDLAGGSFAGATQLLTT